MTLYLHSAAPFGEAAVLKALGGLGLSAGLARCPARGSTAAANWYRLTGPAIRTGILSVRTTCDGRLCEVFVLSQGDELPALPPAQLRLYSGQCAAPPAAREPIATVLPHERLAQTLAALIPPAGGPVLVDWKTLKGLPTGIVWLSPAPREMDLAFWNDRNRVGQSATLALSGRKFSVLVSGSTAEPKTIYIDELGMHPRGEHLLGVLYSQGFAVRLLRCGPVYTSSTNNWYSITSAGTHPAVLRQSIRYEGDQVQDTYELRLDNTLPERGERDRDPGTGGCR
jgi:hypothetical protein